MTNNNDFIALRKWGKLQWQRFQRHALGTLQPCDSHVFMFFLFNANHSNGISLTTIEDICETCGMAKDNIQKSIKRLIENRMITKISANGKKIQFKLNPCFYEIRNGKSWDRENESFNKHSPIHEDYDFKTFSDIGRKTKREELWDSILAKRLAEQKNESFNSDIQC